MEVIVDIDSDEPLFEQLVNQIKSAIKDKKLAPGDNLPSIRQLAGDLRLNNKTVAKAYRLLERDSVIQTKGYRGTFIHPDAVANCSSDIKAVVSDRLADTIKVLREAGATDSEIRLAFAELMKQQPLKGG